MKKVGIFKTAVATLVIGGLLVFSGCGSKDSQTGGSNDTSSSTIKIGWVAPLTGSSADNGQQMLNGAKLAAKQINDAGGINGKQIEIVPQDDKSDPKEAANIANKFTNDQGIVAVLGNYNSSCGLAGAPIYTEAKLPIVHVGTSPAFTEQNYPYAFRISVTDAFQGKFVSDWINGDKHNKVAILYENDDYGRGLKDVVTKEVTTLGGKVAASESYMLGETKDYTAILTNVKNSGADVLFVGGLYTEAALISKQMKQLNLNIPIYGTDGIFENMLIKLGGDAVEGVRASGLFSSADTDPKVQGFVKDYQAAYNSVPGTYAVFDYDATKLLAEVIKQVGTDRTKIKEYLDKMPTPYSGVTGDIVFNNTHDAERSGGMKRLIVKGGQWTLAQ
ncbi:MAG: ABC transporter substrate-binding protein [Eubacteriales bacterium]